MQQILSHSAGGVVDSYARGEAVERRREVQQSWADYLDTRKDKRRILTYRVPCF